VIAYEKNNRVGLLGAEAKEPEDSQPEGTALGRLLRVVATKTNDEDL